MNPESSKDMRPLLGLRVLDLSWVLAGPVAGRLLADAGAEVIKIESRKRLDNTRRGRAVPAHEEDTVSEAFDRVPMFHNLNAGKKSVSVDLSKPEGLSLLKQLVEVSDVVLDNFAPGVMQRLGLGYDVLSSINPLIIAVSMSGTGQEGPLSDVPAYAPTVTSLSGLESVVGYEGEGPVGILGLNLADSFAGLFAFHAILSALWARQETSQGQFVDFSELEGICTMLAYPLMDCAINGRVMAPGGNSETGAAPCGVFPAIGDDVWVAISVEGDQEWHAFCRALKDAPWCDDSRWADPAARIAGRESLNALVASWTKGLSATSIVEKLRREGLKVAPLHGIAQQVHDPYFWERGLFRKVHVAGLGELTLYGAPWRLTETPTLGTTGAPKLGEHTTQILKETLNLSDSRIRELQSTDVLV